jgi:cobalt transporter subunit CbtB
MTTLVQARTQSGVLPVLAAAVLGLGLVFTGGLAQSSALHHAAHDTRHAIGFPCH